MGTPLPLKYMLYSYMDPVGNMLRRPATLTWLSRLHMLRAVLCHRICLGNLIVLRTMLAAALQVNIHMKGGRLGIAIFFPGFLASRKTISKTIFMRSKHFLQIRAVRQKVTL